MWRRGGRRVADESVCYIYGGGDGGCFGGVGGGGWGGGGRREYRPRVALVWVIINDENWTFMERRVRLSEICVYVCTWSHKELYIHTRAERECKPRRHGKSIVVCVCVYVYPYSEAVSSTESLFFFKSTGGLRPLCNNIIHTYTAFAASNFWFTLKYRRRRWRWRRRQTPST